MKDKGTSASEAKTMVSQVTAVSLADTSKLSLEATNKMNKAFWGYARWDIASESSPAMKFGAFNNRPIDEGVVTRLIGAMRRQTIRRCALDTVVPVMIPKDMLNAEEGEKKFSIDLESFPILTSVFKTVPKDVKVLGGQHRRRAMMNLVKFANEWLEKNHGEKELKELLGRRSTLEERLRGMLVEDEKRIAVEAQVSEDQADVDAKLEEIQAMKTLQQYRGMWLIAIYREGTLCVE